MLMKRVLFLLLSVLCISISDVSNVAAQNDSVRIYGSSADYKNMSLVLETIKNYVTSEKSEVGRFKVNKDGSFDASFYISFAQKCFLDLGKIRAFVYLEPGKIYHVVLPPYVPKGEADRFNPYFEPEEVVLGIRNVERGSLNQVIRDFDEQFQYEFSANAFALFNRGNVGKADEIKNLLDSIYPSTEGSYLETHKTYRYARLYMLAMRRQKRTIINNFYSHRPIEFNMPSYWETYSELFKDFFGYYFSSSNGRLLKTAMGNRETFDALSLVMADDTLFSQSDFRESLLLKSLYDSYFTGRYSQETVINLIEQATSVGGSPQICLFASQMLFRINRLRVGTDAPDFTVQTMDGKELKLSDLRGKFVYINFIHTQNYACKKDLHVIKMFAKEFKRELKILTVILDNDADKGYSYMRQNKYAWDITHFGGDGKVLMDYDIKALPVYYLVDPDGKLVLSPAPAPEENFVDYFSDAYKKYKRNNARVNPEKPKSIYDL